jgi:hypothetical protein
MNERANDSTIRKIKKWVFKKFTKRYFKLNGSNNKYDIYFGGVIDIHPIDVYFDSSLMMDKFMSL